MEYLVSSARPTSPLRLHVLTIGSFGEAVAKILQEILPNVIVTPQNTENQTPAVANWPTAQLNVIAAWRPVPGMYRLLEATSYEWKLPFTTIVMETPNVRVGPLVLPDTGPCYSCYEKRVLQHSPQFAALQALQNHYERQPQSGPGGYLQAFAEVGAIRLAQMVVGAEGELAVEAAGQVWQFNTVTRQATTGEVIGLHGCPRCGLKRDETTRSYAPLRQELSKLLGWSDKLDQNSQLPIPEQRELIFRSDFGQPHVEKSRGQSVEKVLSSTNEKGGASWQN